MQFLRAASATAILVFAVAFGGLSAVADPRVLVQASPAEPPPVAEPGGGGPEPKSGEPKSTEPKPSAPESRKAPADQGSAAADREPRTKERTPPPRPIVPPEGQQQNPALREECAWLGQRIVSLLFRDDAMSANDFVPFYDRFGCPHEHLGRAFGCVVSNGNAENDVLADRIAACWVDPAKRPVASSATEDKPAAQDKKSEAPAILPKSAYSGSK